MDIKDNKIFKFILYIIFPIILFFLLVKTGEPVNFENKMTVKNIAGKTVITESFSEKLPVEPDPIVLIAVGDIMLSRMVGQKMDIYGYEYPYEKVKNFLQSGDIVFGNLETSVTPGDPVQSGTMMFRADPGALFELKNAGFNIVSLANNHTPNYGQAGLLDTFKYLQENNIKYTGAGENDDLAYAPVYIEKKNNTFAFLAYNDSDVVPKSYMAGNERAGTAFMDIKKMQETIKDIRDKADFIVVSMHSGAEYVHFPNNSQINFAHAAIDAGADLILGHHPHVVQSAEIYKDKYIFYSLGNFIFDQMWSQETREGMAVAFYITDNTVKNFDLYPVIINDYSQPDFVKNEDANKIIKLLNLK